MKKPSIQPSRPAASIFTLLATILLLALAPATVLATAYTSTGSGGNWNTAATWSPSGVPGSSDTAAIAATAPVSVSDAEAVSTMTLQKGATLTISTGGILTCSGAAAITQSGGTSGASTINLSGGTGTLILSGSGTPVSSSVTLTCGTAGSTVEYTYAGAQTMNSSAYDNLVLSGAGAKGTSITVNGALTLSGSGETMGSAPTYGTSAALVYDAFSGTPSKEWLSTMTAPVTLQDGASVTAGFGGNSTTTHNVTVNSGCTLTLSTKTLTVNSPGVVDISGTIDASNSGNNTLAGTGSCTVENGGVLKSDAGGKSTLISIASLEVKSGGVIQVLGAAGQVPTATWDAGSTLQLLGTGTLSMAASQSFQNVVVNTTACTISTACTINGTLTLTAGTLTVAANEPTLASGANIVRTAGALSGTPTFGATVNVTYNDVSSTTTGTEIPASGTVLNNLTNNNTAGVVLNSSATVNGTLATIYNGSTAPLAVGGNTLTLNNNPVIITVSGSPIANDANYTIISSSGGSVTGSTLGSLTVNGSGAPVSATGESISDGTGQLVLTVAGGAASQLQVVLPGQTGGAGAVAGAPTAQTASVPFALKVYAVDNAGYRVTSATPTVNFTSSDGSATLPANGTTTLVNGRATANVTFNTVGSQTVTATDAASVLTANQSSSVSVLGTAYLQTAPTPGTIFYGQTLANSSLTGGSSTNASGANVPGNFAYTTPTIAPFAGSTNVSVTFTPTSGSYSPFNFTVSVTVNPAVPILSNAPVASAIYISQALSNSVLSGGLCTNATGTVVAGKFAFTSPATTPPLGTANQSVTFTPNDTTNYSTISFNVSVTVTPFSSTTLSPSSTSPWTIPPGVTSITVQMWGGGGAGGAALGNNTAYGAGGGGGGGYSTATLTGLTPGNTIAFSVGAGGVGATGANGTSGGDTVFAGVTTATGGSGGVLAPTSTGGTGGGGTYAGGAGALGTSTYGGGGGSGAGTNAVGVDASGLTGGASLAGGGNGGNGVSVSGSTGHPGSVPGGGGAGAFENGTSARAGGAGGNGEIIISVPSSASSAPTLNVAQSGNTLTFSWTDATYKLQSQTNSSATGLGSNWFDYPGGAASPVGVTIDSGNACVFYRLSQ